MAMLHLAVTIEHYYKGNIAVATMFLGYVIADIAYYFTIAKL